MLYLQTWWGCYSLSNALRIDIYTEKAKKTWGVYLAIDAFKHLVFSFEDERDAHIFCSSLRDDIYDAMMWEGDSNLEWELDELCKAALHQVETQTIKNGESE